MPHRKLPPPLNAPMNTRIATCSLLAAVVDHWKTYGHSMKRSLREPCLLAIFPSSAQLGHEVDFTICDFVADVRAPTPSAAAELITPDIEEWQSYIHGLAQQLLQNVLYQIEKLNDKTHALEKRIRTPDAYLREQTQKLDNLELRLTSSLTEKLQHLKQRFSNQLILLKQLRPDKQLEAKQLLLSHLSKELKDLTTASLHSHQQRFSYLNIYAKYCESFEYY